MKSKLVLKQGLPRAIRYVKSRGEVSFGTISETVVGFANTALRCLPVSLSISTSRKSDFCGLFVGKKTL